MSRLTMISSDGHVQADLPAYRPYMDPEFRDDFEDFIEAAPAMMAKLNKLFHGPDPNARRQRIDTAHQAELDATGARVGAWDPEVRLKVLEADGVVAEVIFPDWGPFGLTVGGVMPGVDHDHHRATARAYNRLLADFCSVAPHRYGGQALLWLHDVDSTLEEVRWAKEHGLRGLVLPGIDESIPMHFDPVYEPLWSLCEELELPINFHIGAGATEFPSDHIDPNVVAAVRYFEVTWFSRRPFWFLVLSGVLERHPRLKVVFTEQYSSWVPMTLAAMDYNWEFGRTAERLRHIVPRRPSEYWARQCYVGASVLSRPEAELRHEIGVDNMMFGVDFPHIESSWGAELPSTIVLQATLGAAGATEDEARRILGLNAAGVFGFDLAELDPIAAEVGPTVEEVLTPMVDPPSEAIEDKFLRSEIMRPVRP